MAHYFRQGAIVVGAVVLSLSGCAATPEAHPDDEVPVASQSDYRPASVTPAPLTLPPEEPLAIINPADVPDGLCLDSTDCPSVPSDEWPGDPQAQSGNMTTLGADLMEVVSLYPENLAEVAYVDEHNYLQVFIKNVPGDGVAEIAAAVQGSGLKGSVLLVPVRYSRADLERAIGAAAQQADGEILGYIDVMLNGIVLSPMSADTVIGSPELVGSQTSTPLGLLFSGIPPALQRVPVLVEPLQVVEDV